MERRCSDWAVVGGGGIAGLSLASGEGGELERKLVPRSTNTDTPPSPPSLPVSPGVGGVLCEGKGREG
ncbi:hypothetical protein E2C01_000666 [Portunus trituberculatus]|uniref:Uncharacterized protein n=1 Tax=Portunus trituberculatus TaxID=210409 RepID=A0A5B7CH65_PORTR|nr:hypothetical protein [Portunus trituberculatus]